MFVTVIPLILYSLSGIPPKPLGNYLLAVLVIFLGIVIFYFISLAMGGVSFIYENTQTLKEVLVNGGSDMNRVPLNILPRFAQLLLTFVVPVAFVSYYPVLIVKNEVGLLEVLSLGLPLLLITLVNF